MKKIKIELIKLLVNTLGKTSTGINMCMELGLTSGKMLDYIYRNNPSGKYVIGKLIDRIFLSHKGWESIRIRKTLLEEFLEKAVNYKLRENEPVLILDIASGPALYIIETLLKFKDKNVEAICRDLEEKWIVEGRKNAEEYGVERIIYEKGNALETDSFRNLPKKPSIIVSSGFYDWIVDDNMVRKSMEIIFQLLEKKGYFIFTNQCGHVDMKMVSEIFPDFNKQPLRMTVRSTDEINSWTKELGFLNMESKSDKWNYYSLTLAQKP